MLDRDGVINRESDAFIKTPAEWQPLPGSLEAIRTLTMHGFDVVVATNQSGVGRGLIDRPALQAIHAKMRDAVTEAGGRLAGVYFCPHLPDEGCDCRKPAPGLLQRIERDFGQSLQGRPVIGDSARDLDAALAVNARPILVRSGRGRATEREYRQLDKVEVCDDLLDAASLLTGGHGRRAAR